MDALRGELEGWRIVAEEAKLKCEYAEGELAVRARLRTQSMSITSVFATL